MMIFYAETQYKLINNILYRGQIQDFFPSHSLLRDQLHSRSPAVKLLNSPSFGITSRGEMRVASPDIGARYNGSPTHNISKQIVF